MDDTKPIGSISEYYFNAGPVPIVQWQSSREPPADLQAFWDKHLRAMRQKPMHLAIQHMPSPWPDVLVDRLDFVNHRGNPMVAYLSRRVSESTALPVALNVYPPMRENQPKPAQRGMVTLTFCGSLQGACRQAGQTEDQTLWARAQSLDDCYWLDVVLDGVRALDAAIEHPWTLPAAMVTGGSRGGWYSMALAAVAPDRVKLACFTSPCYSDVTMNMKLGYGSAAREIYEVFERDRAFTQGEIFTNFRYFDPLFLAGMIRTPVYFSAGLSDSICSAVGMTTAANKITFKPSIYLLDPVAGHGGCPQFGRIHQQMQQRWLDSFKQAR